MYTTRTTCRVCGSDDLTPLFSLGEQYVSDFVDEDEIHAPDKCPINLELCGNCTLVQAKHTAPQEILYSRHYWYRSGVTQTMRNALRDITLSIGMMMILKLGDVVLDIGSNDGTLLRSYSNPNIVRVGVEPAINLAEVGSKGVDRFISDFWSYAGYRYLLGEKKAKVITAIGMFYDLEDPNQFIADVAKALSPDGVFVAQLMCLKHMVALQDVGNLCHEHLEFYSIKSLLYLFNRHGLRIFQVDENDVNGGSYRIYACHAQSDRMPEMKFVGSVCAVKDQEQRLTDLTTYRNFYADLERNRRKVREFIIRKVTIYGKSVWVYGASTKGNVLLQYYNLDNSLISGAADRSPEKWGKYTVGTSIKIYSEEEARAANPDYFLVLPYSFLSEFIDREKEWRDNGGKFIVPLPEFRIV